MRCARAAKALAWNTPTVCDSLVVVTLDLGVLVSGEGTNLQAVLDAVAAGRLDATVRTVISNRRAARALDRARAAGVSAHAISHRDYASREDFDRELAATLKAAGARWVLLAGFMRLLTPGFLAEFPSRVINVHPSLLPAFPGVDAIGQALRYGVRITGCTTHFVDAGTDTGPIIAQRAVPVESDDDADSLAKRMHSAEHELVVETLGLIAADRVALRAGPEGRAHAVTRPA